MMSFPQWLLAFGLLSSRSEATATSPRWQLAGSCGDVRLRTAAPILDLAMPTDGRWVAAAVGGRSIHVWDFATGAERHVFPCFTPHPMVLAARDGRRVLASCEAGSVVAWDLAAGRLAYRLPGRRPLATSTDGRRVAIITKDDGIALFTFTAGFDRPRSRQLIGAPDSEAASAAPVTVTLVPDLTGVLEWRSRVIASDVVATGSSGPFAGGTVDERITVQDTVVLRSLASGAVMRTAVRDARITVPGRSGSPEIAAAEWGGRVLFRPPSSPGFMLWDTRTANGPTPLPEANLGERAAVSRDGRSAVLWSDRGLAVVDLDSRQSLWSEQRAPFDGHRMTAVLASDGSTVIAADWSAEERIVAWDAASGRRLLVARTGGAPLAIDGLGRRLAYVEDGTGVVLWDLRRNQRIAAGSPGAVLAAAVSRDGRSYATAHAGGSVLLWDARTRQPRGPAAPLAGVPLAVAFSEGGGDVVAAARSNHGVVVQAAAVGPRGWQRGFVVTTRTGEALALLPPGRVSLDERGAAYEARAADTAAARLVQTRPGHGRPVIGTALSSSGHRMASLDSDGTVLVWDLTAGAMDPMRTPMLLRLSDSHASDSSPLAMSPDGRVVAVGRRGGGVLVAEVDDRTSQLVDVVTTPDDSPSALAFASQGQLLLVGTARGRLMIVARR